MSNRNAVIYGRVSSCGNNEGRQNTERQIFDLRKYAEHNNYSIVKEFEEKISGAKSEKPILTECFNYCIENNVPTILVSEISRLSRNQYDLQETILKARKNDINIIFQKEGFSLFNADGKENPITPILVAVLGFVCEMERENIKYRLNSGKANYIAKGGVLGRKKGSIKTDEQLKEQYADALKLMKKHSIDTTLALLHEKDVKISRATLVRLHKRFL